jgi:hypothetical protein
MDMVAPMKEQRTKEQRTKKQKNQRTKEQRTKEQTVYQRHTGKGNIIATRLRQPATSN